MSKTPKGSKKKAAAKPVAPSVSCAENPDQSLVEMFVGMVQQGRIDAGQCPAMRPVFLKPHGVAKGVFRMRKDIPDNLKIGLFAGDEYPVWARFSSDTLPTVSDFKTTVGIGLKLFNTPTPKIFGQPEETTFDFIMQNMSVFFVDTAKDMCEFTRAGVVEHDYDSYLKKHPKTAKILDAMEKPVPSVLASPYWAILPFACGKDQYVKYKLVPELDLPPLKEQPADPTYLAADLEERLAEGPAKFTFCVQLRTNPKTMPLDEATVEWPESESPFVPIADVIFDKQDITDRGQPQYGENMSWNIWRVTEDHRPEGSIAEARKVVYAASAELRRNVNGVPNGEPASAKPKSEDLPCKDDRIVRAAIYPGIGIGRVGDAKKDYFIGPETDGFFEEPEGGYRDKSGALKRQAARFRIYGYNAAGEVVRELTAQNANIEWSAHLVNQKANWFRFIEAMDIPETADLSVIRRNRGVPANQRDTLVIDPGPRSITGANEGGKKKYAFNTGKFKGEKVYLGELHTDDQGRLIVLGGHGVSYSPGGKPPYDPADPGSFNNANDWYDDIADGPVDATVSINGEDIPVEGAWFVSAPPNYAPNVVGWRTFYDLLVDTYVDCGWIKVPEQTSFTEDVLPQLQRLSNLQWVNNGFTLLFGQGGPMDFTDPKFLARLNLSPDAIAGDPYQELRRQIFHAFRPHDPKVNEPRLWPSIYGDSFDGDLFDSSPRTMLALPSLQELHLMRWVAGDFISDYGKVPETPSDFSKIPLADQPEMLTKAALHFCLADAFHPGCEMTWPMRHSSLYEKPFRISRRLGNHPQDVAYQDTMTSEEALALGGPLYAQEPGSITRWMGLPWQGDTAYCRSGYDPSYDPYLPTYWPARVPNQVLTEADYKIVMDESNSREERIAAYNRRANWHRFVDQGNPGDVAKVMDRMVKTFGQQGIVEARPGVENDPDFPAVIYVENIPESQVKAAKKLLTLAAVAPASPRQELLDQAGWGSEEALHRVIMLRSRQTPNS